VTEAAPGGKGRTIIFHRLDALQNCVQRKEVIEGLLAVGEIGAIVAPAGEGKSAIAQLLVTCVAENRPFLGRQVMAGPSIYIAAERGNEAIRRLRAVRSKDSAPLYVATGRPNLSDLSEVEELAKGALRVCRRDGPGPVLIVIDTLARCMPGLEENSAKDMGKVVEGLTNLLETVPTAAIIFVHHAGKSGNGEMRGSTALIGAVDLEMRVERSKGSGSAKRLTASKANAVAEGQSLGFRLVTVPYRNNPDADEESVIAAIEADIDKFSLADGADTEASRSESVLAIIKDVARQGVADRKECLQAVRRQNVVCGKSPASTAEQFRRLLLELKKTGCINFDKMTILLCPGATPNMPNGPP
jgi:hypothetical protein